MSTLADMKSWLTLIIENIMKAVFVPTQLSEFIHWKLLCLWQPIRASIKAQMGCVLGKLRSDRVLIVVDLISNITNDIWLNLLDRRFIDRW